MTCAPASRMHPCLWALSAGGLLAWSAASCAATKPTDEPEPESEPETSPTTTTAPIPSDAPASRWLYTLGVKLQSTNAANTSPSLTLRPVLGLRYGRWRMGHPTGTEWLNFSGYRRESNLAYQWRDDDRLKVGLSLRVQNLQDNSTFDGFSSGQKTLRGRVSANYKIDRHWSLGSDLTHDLMGRGDGTTLSLGAAYSLPLSDHSALSLSAGLNWASADHWATQWRQAPPTAEPWHSGLGSMGVGMSYRFALTPQWAWFGSLSSSHPLGQVQSVSPGSLSWQGQLGLLYFSR
jgi:hypothetical protein